MQFLTIDKNRNGSYTITNTITNTKNTYYFCSLKEAIRLHRLENNLKYKHLKKNIFRRLKK